MAVAVIALTRRSEGLRLTTGAGDVGVVGAALVNRIESRSKLGRPIAAAITIGVAIGILASTVQLLPGILDQWGEDYRFFVGAADRWVNTGNFYMPHQLAGPYEARTAVDVLYPPIALYLFVPFVYVPPVLWWLIPLGIVTWHVVTCRPAWWIWPVIAIAIWLPRTQSMIIWGNTGIWIAAFVALGVRWAGPAALVVIKPTFPAARMEPVFPSEMGRDPR